MCGAGGWRLGTGGGGRGGAASAQSADVDHPPHAHTQGTTVALALLSSAPEWAARIHLAVLLAPVAFATHLSSPPLAALAKLDTDEARAPWAVLRGCA